MKRSFSTNVIGISSAIGAAVCFSVNDMGVKFLSGDYPLHEVILLRASIGMVVLLAILVPLQGGMANLRTRRLPVHVLRGLCVVFANMMFFLGLAAMPLADAAAIFFISPLIITAFSVVFLGEKVGPRRWLAVGIGMLGVIVVMRPGSSAFQLASLLPLAAAVGYAFLHILTRRIGGTESALAMTFYIQLTFIVVSGAIGLGFGDGRFAGTGDPSLEFLLREWVWPQSGDIWVLVLIGCASTFGGFLISQAYRLCEAGLAAPFEYIALPLAIFWGFVIFGEWPDIMTWVGVAMIIAGGLYMVWRETRVAQTIVAEEPTRR
jgi:drug/metabolite transporter (DMT)-like permease